MSSIMKELLFSWYYFLAIVSYIPVHASHNNKQCTYSTQEDRIINIHESKALGAELLGALQMTSLADCSAACCEQMYGKCNMAFYHEVNTDEKNCFLALCEPIDVCVLSTLEGFSATTLSITEVEEETYDKSFLTTFLNELENEFRKDGATTTSPSSLLEIQTTESPTSTTELSTTRPTSLSTTTVNIQTTTYIGKLKKCEKELLEASSQALIGSYIPQCKKNGDYEPIQCHASTGYCWCVDKNGVKIEGTDVGRGQGKPNCDAIPAKQIQTSAPSKTTRKPTEKHITTTKPLQTSASSRTTQKSHETGTHKPAAVTSKQRIEATTKLKGVTGVNTKKPADKVSAKETLKPQDSRQMKLPSLNTTTTDKPLPNKNETAAAVQTQKKEEPSNITISYLSSNGALVAAICFGVLFLGAVCVLVGKRWYEGYQRRHYNKMDYLINGMYN